MDQAILKAKKAALDLDNIFGVPVREKVLVSRLKKICSNVRNTFREDVRPQLHAFASLLALIFPQIRKSIDPDDFVPLERFTYDMATKYKLGGVEEELSELYTVHAALLVRLCKTLPDTCTQPGLV